MSALPPPIPLAGRHSYRPSEGHGLAHDPLNAIVAPRPIGWIGTRSASGIGNLAPYSFFNLFNYWPPILGFASGGRKDSLTNAEETGEFVWNLATRALADAMNQTSAPYGTEVNELAQAGLTALPGIAGSVPLVAESPVAFECRVTQIVQLADAGGRAIESWLVLGEAVAIHIDRRLIRDGVFDTVAAEPIMRGGGPADYFAITPASLFLMKRPK